MRQEQSVTTDPYFWTLPLDEFIDEAHGKIEEFYQDLLDTGIFAVIDKSYRAYFGADLSDREGGLFDSAELRPGGTQGELTRLKMNHFRSIIKQTLQLATSTKPAFSCRSSNTDYKSQTQTVLGNGLVDFYMREKKLARDLTDAVEMALVMLEGWIHDRWNPNAGERYDEDPETGAVVYEGDFETSVHSILDVPRDIHLRGKKKHNWLFVRRQESKFDLAARYPDLADRILAIAPDAFDYAKLPSFGLELRKGNAKNSEHLDVWTCYHAKSEAMKEGRLIEFVGDVGLLDGPLPYRDIPLRRVSPDKLLNTSYGYSLAVDLLGPQEAHDILTSTIMSNNATHGVQNVWTQRNDALTVNDLGKGMRNLQSDAKPEPIQLTQTAPETFSFRKEVEGDMETLSGISSTVRGNPEASLKSGSALAMVVSQSIQFASMLEDSYNELVGDVGTDLINMLRDFSKTERVAMILGESSRPFMREFNSSDLSTINRVVVEPSSPLSKTVAGRMQIADDLFQKGLITTPKQYITILVTGQLEPAIEGSTHEMLNIRAENEELREGRPVKAIITDLHADHIAEHRAILSNPESRRNPKLVEAVLAHIQDHLGLWRSADPGVLMVTGQQMPPPPPMPAMPPPGPGPGGPGGAGPGPQGTPAPGATPAVMAPQKPVPGPEPRMPNMPSLPSNAPDSAQAALDKVA